MRFLKSKKSIALLIALVALAVWLFQLVEDEAGMSLAESIEARGSRVLGTRVDVSEVQMDASGGNMTVSGLVVANPGGFSDNNMISVDDIGLEISPGERVIERIHLAGAAVLLEFRGARTNFEALGERIAKRAAGASASPGADAADQSGDSGNGAAGSPPARDDWRVELVEFGNIRVTLGADWTSEVIEYDTGALAVENLDAGADDLARAVTARLLDKVLVSAAAEVEDDRLREALMEEADELRARLAPPE